MFRTYAYDLATTATVIYSDDTTEMFHIIAEQEIEWHGSWAQWSKDMVDAIKRHTNYLEKEWDFIRLVFTDTDEDNSPCIVIIRLYRDYRGNTVVEDIARQYL